MKTYCIVSNNKHYTLIAKNKQNAEKNFKKNNPTKNIDEFYSVESTYKNDPEFLDRCID